jgi:Fis family transcriptional regulator, factor for inversion stimulation protein
MKDQLEVLVKTMYRSGLSYEAAVREFQKCFIETVLKENRGHQIRAAQDLGMHRNSLSRAIAEFEVNVQALRAERRPPKSERMPADKRISR